jgi:hypothetical protein
VIETVIVPVTVPCALKAANIPPALVKDVYVVFKDPTDAPVTVICPQPLFTHPKESTTAKTTPNALEVLKIALALRKNAKKALKTLVSKALKRATGLVLKGFCCIIKDRKSPMNGISSKERIKSCIFSAI